MMEIKGKEIVFTHHAREQMLNRGASEGEVIGTLEKGNVSTAKRAKKRSVHQFPGPAPSPISGRLYKSKAIDVIYAEETTRIVVITVKVYYYD